MTFLPELPFIDNPNLVQIVYGVALITIILLLPAGIVGGIAKGYGGVKRFLKGHWGATSVLKRRHNKCPRAN